MDSIIEYNQENAQIQEGKKIIKNNEFLRDLSSLMENEEFKKFFKKHMSNWADIKCTAIYMRLYSEFKKKYKNITDEELNKNIVVFLLRKLMCDKELRPFSIKMIDKMHEERWKSKKFWNEFEDFMIKNKTQNLIADISRSQLTI